MSAIAVLPPPRPASRVRGRGCTTGQVSEGSDRQPAVRSSSRPRLRLVTDDFVPEVSERCGDDASVRHLSVASDSIPTPSSMRRPSRPAALRDRRSELEALAPQHPAVRAARLRAGSQDDSGSQRVRSDVGAASQGRPGRPGRTVRSRVDLRLLRDDSLVVIAAIVLACCGLMLGGLVGLTSSTSAAVAGQAPVSTVTTVVRPGQSLWEIAAASGTSDVAGTVARIVELNDLQDTTVRAGQTLEVPSA